MADRERPPIERPKTAAEEAADLTAAKIARLGVDAKCETCFHAYQVRLQPLDRAMSWVCYHSPAQHTLLLSERGMSMQHVPRVVAPGFFCHQWKTRD